MNEEQKEAIRDFFKSTEVLKNTGVIRSSSYTGDIAEFICADKLSITLAESQREKGLDGVDSAGRKVQIKYHGGKSGTNIIMNSYSEGDFDDLVVVLGPESRIRPESLPPNTFVIYKIENYFEKDIVNIARNVLDEQAVLLFQLDEHMEIDVQ